MSETMLKLPAWDGLEPAGVLTDLRQMLDQNRAEVERLLDLAEPASWYNFAGPLEELEDRLDRFWFPVSHMHSVNNTEQWRAAYDAALPILTQYNTELGQHTGLYQRWQALAESTEFAAMDAARKRSVELRLRDYKLAGVALTGKARQRYAELRQTLSSLGTRFSNNVLDATAGWEMLIENVAELAGLPTPVLELLARQARDKNLRGFRITLDLPSYLPVLQSCENRELRSRLYQAYTTRAAELGPGEGRWDNSDIMLQILAARQELAQLLGFANYAEYSLAPKMAESAQKVQDFLYDLAERAKPVARLEMDELQEFAAQELNLPELAAWDVAFASEKLRQQRFQLSQQGLRPWFPVSRVIEGLFSIAGRLFDIVIRPAEADCYHPDVGFYEICRSGKRVAGFYMDLFARPQKQGGAWMSDCNAGRTDSYGTRLLPVALLSCNFTPLDEAGVSLLTHDEVTTLFHEFGHGLHHMLSQVHTAWVSGINGVEWDAVELPSQFMENWCWQREALGLISGHVDTGEPLGEAQLQRLLAAKNFQSALQLVRQLEFALFDMAVHTSSPASSADIQHVLNQVRQQVSALMPPSYNRFQHSFSHIFAGGYAAGYYSYKWAEVLSADAFARFEEAGVFNPQVGEAFRREILATGSTRPALKNFIAFRGREPSAEALLRQSGLKSGAANA